MLTSAALASRNLGEVLRFLHRNGTQSRASVAAGLQISRSATGKLLSGLADLGLVSFDEALRTGRAGRPSPTVVVGRSGPTVLCVEASPDDRREALRCSSVVVALSGSVIVARQERSVRDECSLLVDDLIAATARILPSGCYLAGIAVTGPGAGALLANLRRSIAHTEWEYLRLATHAEVELAAWGELLGGGVDSALAVEASHPYRFHFAHRTMADGISGAVAPPASPQPLTSHAPDIGDVTQALSLLRTVLCPDSVLVEGGERVAVDVPAPACRVRRADDADIDLLHTKGLGAAELFFRPWFTDPVGAEDRRPTLPELRPTSA